MHHGNYRKIVAAVALVAGLSVLWTSSAAALPLPPPTPDIKIGPSTVTRNYSIDVNAVCRWQYGSSARSVMLGQSWRDWRCVVGGVQRSVNFTGYCRARYGHYPSLNITTTATHRSTGSWTSTSWRCTHTSPRNFRWA
jgi:hypothetical protein